MNLLRGFLQRLASMFRREQHDNDLAAELDSHLQFHIEDNLRAGMSPEEARRQARIKLGGLDQAKESVRAQRAVPWLESVAQDVRFALRMLRKNPGFTATAVLTLALGIGANTAIFTLIDAVMLRLLPVKNPQELVSLTLVDSHDHWTGHGTASGRSVDGNSSTAFPYPAFERMRDQNEVFSSLFAFKDMPRLTVAADGSAEILQGEMVTPNYFSALGIRPVAGRDFTAADDKPDSTPVALISYGYWQRRFGGEPGISGKQMTVNNVPVTICGVLPRGFFGLQAGSAPEIYMDVAMQPQIQPRIAEPAASALTATDGGSKSWGASRPA